MFAAITEPSALLSNARSTITALIQRPSSITTSNAFDEFSILDRLIDVSKDVDRLEDGETRKFVNIAQVITASTCIYSRRVDALYKLINNFTDNPTEDKSSSEENEQSTPTIAIDDADDNSKKTKKTKPIDQQTSKEKSSKRRRSFISLDPDKLNYNTNKGFFLDRTSIVEIKLFQNYVPMGNKQFWFDDSRPVIFDLLFDEPIRNLPEIQEEIVHVNEPERLIDVVNQVPSMDQEIPLPDRDYFDDDRENIYPPAEVMVPERKKVPTNAKNRTKKIKPNEMDRNIFRRSLTDEEQGLFVCHKMKPLTATKTQGNETKDFFLKKFQRKHFDALIKDCPSSILPLFIYPIITVQYQTIRERYSVKSVPQAAPPPPRSPALPLSEAIDQDHFLPLFASSPMNPSVEEDADLHLRSQMEQFLDTALDHTSEGQQHNRIFLSLRSLIIDYVNEHRHDDRINAEDLIASLPNEYSLALVFSQLLQFCASTQRYCLQSNSSDQLILEKVRSH